MNKDEREVLNAAIMWYREVLRFRDKLSSTETKLFYAVSLLEHRQSIKIPTDELYEENNRSTTPAPSPLIDDLVKRSKKESDGD